MKKYYIFLSISAAILIGFTTLAILYFHDYYEIIREINKLELDFTLTSLFPFISEEGNTTTKERPDTSNLQKNADVSLTLGIVFTVIVCIALVTFIIFLIKILKKNQTPHKEIGSSIE